MKHQIAFPVLGKEEEKNLLACVRSGWISSRGAYIEKFEKSFARFCRTRYGVSCSNGTVALTLALMALDIKKGDEVIIPNLTFGATANAAMILGVKPVLVDIDQATWNIDPLEIEKNISPRTKAIIPVHLYGLPCEMKKIRAIAKKYKLKIIEDAAEAHGAEYNGKRAGNMSDIGCFSFFGNKIMTTGEGGMCVTNDRKLYEKMKLIKNHGMEAGKRYWHEILGYNFRMTNMQAAVGLAQMGKVDRFIKKKIQIADWYKEEIARQGVNASFQKETARTKSVWWMFTVFIKQKNTDRLMAKLAEKGIDTRPIFIPLSIMPAYKNLRKSKKLGSSLKIGQGGISLPTNLNLTKKDVGDIIKELKLFV